jgi:hypothetical protein
MIPFLRILTYFTSRLGDRELTADAIFLVSLVLVLLRPELGDRFFLLCETAATRFAEKREVAIGSLVVGAVLARLLLLIYLPIPIPTVHDEFAHLLAADTFVHGRLSNPMHPLWVFFDTIHVNQVPAYMSKYPPGQGAVLAVGEMLGNPWIGVLLSVAAMCAAALWMLQGWLPSKWALLGGILLLARTGISSYWINSYWGGAVPAIGGALVVGALPRIQRLPRTRHALALGIGAFILANSRPFEGLVLCAAVVVVLLLWVCSAESPPLRVTTRRLILPFCGCMLLCGAFLGYYNWRLTGNPLLLPEALNEHRYSRSPDFIWQQPESPIYYSNPQFEVYYNGWTRGFWERNRVDTARGFVKHVGTIASKSTYFYLWPELCVPLIALPWILGDRSVRFVLLLVAVSFVGSFVVVWFLPHYSAPVAAPVFCLVVQMIRHLRQWKFRGHPLGMGVSRVVVLMTIVLAPFHWRGGTIQPDDGVPPAITYRAKIAAELDAMPGKHLALVEYAPTTGSGEWVYNSADIDHAKVVWARVIPGRSLQPLLDYFKGRQVWRVEPDAMPPRLTRYAEPPPR